MKSALFEIPQMAHRRSRKALFPTAVQRSPREQHLRDIAIAGNEDAAECAAFNSFKDFPSQEGR